MNYLIFFGGLCILFVILKFLALPLRMICRFIINSIIGGVIFYFLAKLGIIVLITWWTILLAGILGIPGVVIVTILSILI